MIEAKLILTEDNFMEGVDLHYKYKRRRFNFLQFYGILLLLSLISTSLKYGFSSPMLFVLAGGLFLVGLKFVMKQMARRSIKDLPAYNQEITYQLDEIKLSGASVDTEFSHTWKSMLEAFIKEDGILVYLQKIAFIWLPKSAFSSEEDFQQVIEYVKNGVSKYKIV